MWKLTSNILCMRHNWRSRNSKSIVSWLEFSFVTFNWWLFQLLFKLFFRLPVREYSDCFFTCLSFLCWMWRLKRLRMFYLWLCLSRLFLLWEFQICSIGLFNRIKRFSSMIHRFPSFSFLKFSLMIFNLLSSNLFWPIIRVGHMFIILFLE